MQPSYGGFKTQWYEATYEDSQCGAAVHPNKREQSEKDPGCPDHMKTVAGPLKAAGLMDHSGDDERPTAPSIYTPIVRIENSYRAIFVRHQDGNAGIRIEEDVDTVWAKCSNR